MKTRILIDTDPGIDDAVALLLAVASPELELVGVTTVAGNVTQSRGYENAHRVLAVTEKEVTVYPGCEAPMIKQLAVNAEEINGTSGLGGADWPGVNVRKHPVHAVDFIIQQCLNNKDSPITICPLGPLTNLAVALVKQPEISEGIREVVIMGGALRTEGNTSQYAEFNFYTDPAAAHIIFKACLPVTLCPLDITNNLVWPAGWLQKLPSFSRACSLVASMLSYYESGPGGGLHDPAVIAWLLEPELFQVEACDIDIEIHDQSREGLCLTQWQSSGKVKALTRVDVAGFFELLLQRLGSLD